MDPSVSSNSPAVPPESTPKGGSSRRKSKPMKLVADVPTENASLALEEIFKPAEKSKATKEGIQLLVQHPVLPATDQVDLLLRHFLEGQPLSAGTASNYSPGVPLPSNSDVSTTPTRTSSPKALLPLAPANSVHEEWDDMRSFALGVRNKRIQLQFTQADVGIELGRLCGQQLSYMTVSRFELCHFSFSYMRKLRPRFQEWLDHAEAAMERQNDKKAVKVVQNWFGNRRQKLRKNESLQPEGLLQEAPVATANVPTTSSPDVTTEASKQPSPLF